MRGAPTLRLVGGLLAGSALAVLPSLLLVLLFAVDRDGTHLPSRTAVTGLRIVTIVSLGVSLIIGLPLILHRLQRGALSARWLLLTGAGVGASVVLIPLGARLALGAGNWRDLSVFALAVLLGAASGALAGAGTWWLGVRHGELDGERDRTG